MATIGEVQATIPGTNPFSENQVLPIKVYFGVFFDGTGNNMVQREAAMRFKERNKGNKNWEVNVVREKTGNFKDGANQLVDNKDGEGREYSNVAILHSHYQGMTKDERKKEEKKYLIYVYNIYIEGAGVNEITHDKDLNPNLRKYWDNPLNAKGSGFGLGKTGVVALVSKAIHLVKMRLANYNPNIKSRQESEGESNKKIELHFDVIGFSRGAACARLFAFMVATDRNRELPCEKEFKHYLPESYYMGEHINFLDDFKNRSVDYLGIFDTVSSIGLSYDDNVTDFGLYSPSLKKVEHTFHLCALDEFRSHFAITDIGSNPPSTGLEVFIPGCHSDVGGGYLTGDFPFCIHYRNTRMYMSKLHSNSEKKDIGKAISQSTLGSLGWWSNGSCVKYEESVVRGDISFERHIQGGYSNIPLEMMAKRSENIGLGRKLFKEIIRYKVPYELKTIQADCKKYITETEGRRFFYYPGYWYSSYKYCALRSYYLHYSATDNLFEKDHTSLVHSVSVEDIKNKELGKVSIISRYLYHGDKGDTQRHYISDYE